MRPLGLESEPTPRIIPTSILDSRYNLHNFRGVHSLLKSLQYSSAVFPPFTTTVPYPEASNITVGDGFYSIVSHLPPGEYQLAPTCLLFTIPTLGTHVIWGVNMRDDNLTAVHLETKSIIKAFSNSAVTDAGITLAYLEIGNEADLYVHNGGRQNPWGATQYVAE